MFSREDVGVITGHLTDVLFCSDVAEVVSEYVDTISHLESMLCFKLRDVVEETDVGDLPTLRVAVKEGLRRCSVEELGASIVSNERVDVQGQTRRVPIVVHHQQNRILWIVYARYYPDTNLFKSSAEALNELSLRSEVSSGKDPPSGPFVAAPDALRVTVDNASDVLATWLLRHRDDGWEVVSFREEASELWNNIDTWMIGLRGKYPDFQVEASVIVSAGHFTVPMARTPPVAAASSQAVKDVCVVCSSNYSSIRTDEYPCRQSREAKAW